MKPNRTCWWLMVCVCLLGLVISSWAQVETGTGSPSPAGAPPPFDPNTADLPMTKEQYWMFGIAFITPVIVWLFGKIPQLPRPILPLLAPAAGIVLGLILDRVGNLNLDWWDGAKAGTVAVFIRESVNQLVTKQLKPREASKTKAKPVDKAVAVKGTEVTTPRNPNQH